MKIISFIIFIFSIYKAISAPAANDGVSCKNIKEEDLEYVEGKKTFYFPDSEGNIHLVDSEQMDVSFRFDATKQVEFLLYTRKNSNTPSVVKFQKKDSLRSSNFDHTKPTKVIIHGWRGNGRSSIFKMLKDAFLEVADVNVICVNWGEGASTIFYPTAVNYVPHVGRFVAQFVDWLIAEGSDIKSFHLMGHSLGAHAAAFAARSVKSGKIPMLIGFDPANPLWVSNPGKISSKDSEYVEVIHTNAGRFGLKEAVGHNDFYPNGGKKQPGCSFCIGCSHSRSYEYYAESILNDKFIAMNCKDLAEVKSGMCKGSSSVNMGGLKSKPKIGLFYVKTANKSPFHLI